MARTQYDEMTHNIESEKADNFALGFGQGVEDEQGRKVIPDFYFQKRLFEMNSYEQGYYFGRTTEKANRYSQPVFPKKDIPVPIDSCATHL